MDPSSSAFEAAVLAYRRSRDPLAVVSLFAAEPVVPGRWRAETVLTLPVFLALVMDGAPAAAAALVDAVRGGDAVKVEVAAQALNYSHHPQRQRLMERLAGAAAAGGMDRDGADFAAFAPTHPVHVDMLWMAFLATGDTRYVERVAGLLAGWMPEPELQALLAVAGRDDSVREKAMAGVLANAALVGLTVNARDMDDVRSALEGFAARSEGLAAALASRVLAGITRTP
ncbi:hypothetical protein [Magnetospirillum sp. UT-4]|uniref:hypothetical protein n=1 Tax=Magnetospirillum sp. UT-4 TaxID=2681467 RepID=UPI001384DCD3|nr:hypothetical protein [Magnetospirillum sp. UT-4]CAA7614195.1 conserved hypothetical protein [Magnetospirillum sp. UT-4]